MCLFEIFFPQFCENESRMICRVSQIVSTVGGHYGQNGQTLHENGKISIFGSKQRHFWGIFEVPKDCQMDSAFRIA